MDPLHHDLARLTSGEVFTDPLTREAYATAACIYRLLPRAVVWPKQAEEVAAIVAYAAERGLPVTARGAGSSVAGQALGAGLIIDFTRHLNRVIAITPETREAVIEPGLILAALNRELAGVKLRFPPDPSSGDYATLGGMIANNSSGPHSIRCGDTRAWTRKLKCVLADGSIAWLEPKPILPPALSRSDSLENRVYAELPRLLEKHGQAIDRSRPRVSKNSSGYYVWDLVRGRDLDPTPLIVGSEGTLAVVVKAVVGLDPLPPARAAALFGYGSVQAAAASTVALLKHGPSALEIMDDLFIALVREHRPDLRPLLPADARAALLIEFEDEAPSLARERLAQARATAEEIGGGGFSVIVARDDAEIARLFEVRKAASPILYRLPGRRLTRFVEDVVVPPDRLAEGIETIRAILARHGTSAPILGHAGSGNLHLNPRLNLEDPKDLDRMKAIADELYAAVIAMGGTISGEHGDGMLRAPYVNQQFPELIPLFHEIKELFDPRGVLNPGKKLSDADSIPLEPLRVAPPAKDASSLGSLQRSELFDELLRCHGCGLCRAYCPVARAMEDELALPRAKVSILRALAVGDLAIDQPEVRAGLERLFTLCTACQRCVTGCPTGIEPSRLLRALLHDLHQREGRPLRECFFGLSPALLRASSHAPRAVTAVTHNPALRRALELGLGVNRLTPMPRPAGDAWKQSSTGPTTGTGAPLVLYPGCLGRRADEEGASRAAIEILRGLGLVLVFPDLPCCGEVKLSIADLAGAAKEAGRLSSLLAPYVRDGALIVTTCQACALMLQREHPRLLGETARDIAAATREIFEVIVPELERQDLAPQAPPSLAGKLLLHRGCHEAARGHVSHVAKALARVGGLELIAVDDLCCGLAGVHGLRVENREIGAALARKLVAAAENAGTRRVISACPACRLQIRALGLEALSPLVVLRDALLKSSLA